MKRSVLMLFLFCLASFPLLAQDQQQDDELLPPSRSVSAKMGGAGGLTPFYLYMDVGPINEVLRRSNASEFDNGHMLLLGGQGYAYIYVVKNLRVGGMGVSGNMKSRSLMGSTRREVQMKVGFGGVTVDYVIPVVPRLDVALGIMLGSGGVDLTINRDNGTAKVWNDLWSEYGDSLAAEEYTRKMSGSFFVYQPSMNVEFALLRWIGLRAGVSYIGMAGGSWQLDDKYDIYGVPSSVSGKGWAINAGVFLGTFLY